MSWNMSTSSWMSPSRMTAKLRHMTHPQSQRPSGERSSLVTVMRQREEAYENAAAIGARLLGRLLP